MRFEFLDIVIKQVLPDAVNAQSNVGSPIDGIDVEIKEDLFIWAELIEDIYGLDALAQPFFLQKETVFLDNSQLLLDFMALSGPFYLPRFQIKHISKSFFNIRWKILSYLPYLLVYHFFSDCYLWRFHSILLPGFLPIFYKLLQSDVVPSSCGKVKSLILHDEIFNG